MNDQIYTCLNADQIAAVLAEKVLNLLKDAIIEGRQFNIAISGGSTTRILASQTALLNQDPGTWNHARFYWVDERCVPPDHEDSNYGLASEFLLRRLSLSHDQIFRMKGEDVPGMEAIRYASLLQKQIPLKKGFPCFDLVLLGMGPDGHTASIFPDNMDLLKSETLCEVAKHPESGQNRITKVPAGYIRPVHGSMEWIIDGDAARLLNKK